MRAEPRATPSPRSVIVSDADSKNGTSTDTPVWVGRRPEGGDGGGEDGGVGKGGGRNGIGGNEVGGNGGGGNKGGSGGGG